MSFYTQLQKPVHGVMKLGDLAPQLGFDSSAPYINGQGHGQASQKAVKENLHLASY
jgi:hypothetical protein